MRKISLLLILAFVYNFSAAQELKANVTVASNQVGNNVNPNVFRTLQTALNTFINTRKWTADTYQPNERIDCNFFLNLQSTGDLNVYNASLTIQAARPVFNTSYLSPIINFKDDNIVFKLLIGNSALAANRRLAAGDWPGPPLQTTDLGAAWLDLTDLPFVYAVWAAPAPAADPTLAALLDDALAAGLRQRAEMARDGARQLGISEAEARAYLLDTIRYRLGPDERAGLARFCDLAREHGILPPASAVRYAGEEG